MGCLVRRRRYARGATVQIKKCRPVAPRPHPPCNAAYSRSRKNGPVNRAPFARAAALARRYEAVRKELRAGLVRDAACGRPVLEPSDPSSSEARWNMLCTPDRPGAACHADAADAGGGGRGSASMTAATESGSCARTRDGKDAAEKREDEFWHACCLNMPLVRALFGK